MVKAWQDDIDTILVFSGLFSAVITTLVIELYQGLDEDPTDAITLLNQLLSAQVNSTQSISLEPPQFKPNASSIHINAVVGELGHGVEVPGLFGSA
uniref:DUF6535 domain-containing protein n=1 Tax=Moniliophthora roreri TaxID=221103 RepID=A0A0W0F9K5_MONRR